MLEPVAPDGDTAGHAVETALAERAHALGWSVSLLPALEGYDWNDILTANEVQHECSWRSAF